MTMKKAYSNWKDLKNAIESKAKKSLETNAKRMVRQEMNNQIVHQVYNVYEPTMYNRTYSLFKLDNYKHEIRGDIEDSLTISIEHMAMSKDRKNLSKLIILGQVQAKRYHEDIALYNDEWIKMTKFRYAKEGRKYDTAFYHPRDFVSTTEQVLSTDSNRKRMVEELKKGMR